EHLVEAGDQAAVFAHDRTHARIDRGIALDRRPAAVGRAVVDDQELEIAEALAEHAVDRLGEESLAVVDAHRDRGRRGAHWSINSGGSGARRSGRSPRATRKTKRVAQAGASAAPSLGRGGGQSLTPRSPPRRPQRPDFGAGNDGIPRFSGAAK